MQISRSQSGPHSLSRQFLGKSPVGALAIPKPGTKPPASPALIIAKMIAPSSLCAVLWSHIWIGPGPASALAFLAGITLFALARLVPDFGNKSSFLHRIGYGEKVWLNRIAHPPAPQMTQQITVLFLVFSAGLLTTLAAGLLASPMLTATGLLVTSAAQYVYFMKLSQLYSSVRNQNPLYKFWMTTPENDNQPGQSRRKA